jgi:hypothetical protein
LLKTTIHRNSGNTPQFRPGPLALTVLALLSAAAFSQASEIPPSDSPPPAIERTGEGKPERTQIPNQPIEVVKWVGALGAMILLARTLRRR